MTTKREPYIWLQPNENEGVADCGCSLTYDDDGDASVTLCRMHEAAPALVEALRAFVEWGRTFTGPRDPHSPHTLLIAGVAALALVDGEGSGETCRHCGGSVNYVGAPGCSRCERQDDGAALAPVDGEVTP